MNSFISYRRDDRRDISERIYDRLTAHFGGQAVFKDVDSIPVGADFRQVLHAAVSKCDVLLVIIGDRWLNITDQTGKRRLDDQDDYVRIEIETAFENGISVIPVLVGGARMPKPTELPESIQKLAFRNGIVVRPDPDFHRDVDKLIRLLTEHVVNELVAQTETMPHIDLLGSLQEQDIFRHFTEVVERNSSNTEMMLKRGQMAYTWARTQGGGGYRQATEDFRQAVAVNSKLADPHFGLGTIYFDLAVFDLVRRKLFQIHHKGKIRINTETGLPEIMHPVFQLFPDNETRSILRAALDEFEAGMRLYQLHSQDAVGTHVMFAPRDMANRVHYIRYLLGLQPMTTPDDTLLSVFTMFFNRVEKDGFDSLFEPEGSSQKLANTGFFTRIRRFLRRKN